MSTEKRMFSYICGSPNEWPWMKCHRSAWHLTIVSLGLSSLTSIIMISAKTVNISRFFPYKYIRNQIWPCHKVGQGQARFIICANLVGPTSTKLHTKYQGHWPFGSKKIFKKFSSYMGLAAILVMWPEQFVKFWLTYHKESSYEIWVQLA